MSGRRRSFRLERGQPAAAHSFVGPGVLAALFAVLVALAGVPAHLTVAPPADGAVRMPVLAHSTRTAEATRMPAAAEARRAVPEGAPAPAGLAARRPVVAAAHDALR